MALVDHAEAVEPTMLIAVGFLLVVIPEPATSTLGIGLLLLGAAWWIQEWRSTSAEDEGGGRRVEVEPRP